MSEDKGRISLKFPKGTSKADADRMIETIRQIGSLTGGDPAEVLDAKMIFDQTGSEANVWVSDEGYVLRREGDEWFVSKDDEKIHDEPLADRTEGERIAARHFLKLDLDGNK